MKKENAIEKIKDVENESQFDRACELLKQTKEAWELIETERKELKSGSLKDCHDVDERAKKMLRPLKEKETALRELVEAYAFKEQQRLLKQILPDNASAAMRQGALMIIELPKAHGVSFKQRITVGTVDPDLIPDRYKVISYNYKKLVADYTKGVEIPGVTFDESLSSFVTGVKKQEGE